MNRARPVYVRLHGPFELSVLWACTIVGSTLAVSGVRPPSVARGLDDPLLTGWLVMLAVGGLVGLVGCYWRGRDLADRLVAEFAGMVAIGCACSLYVAALFAGNPPHLAFASGGLLAALAAGAWWRAGQCVVDWLRLRRARPARVRVDLPLMVEDDAGGGPA